MDTMLLGEVLYTDSGGQSFTGFWMPARGNNGVGAIEVFMIDNSATYEVKLETKKSDEADAGASSIGSTTFTGTGITKFDVDDAQDLVRYVVSQSGEGSGHLHFQLSQPLWAPN